MNVSTAASALVGGALIGIGASLLLLTTGRLAGVAGIVGGLLRPAREQWSWRAAFVGGLLAGGALFALLRPGVFAPSPRAPLLIAIAGVAVGFGTRLGGGCTSGHGVCGVSRLQPRSLVATVIFVLVGATMVAMARAMGVVA
jgi:uncharacterized membrane protein YedE/YeeE